MTSKVSQGLHILGCQHEVVTTEKVPLRYRVAGLGSRYLAWLIDFMVIGLLVLIGLLLAGLLEGLRPGLGQGVAQFQTFVLFWGYFLLFEWLWSGQTPGKRMLGVRVIDEKGAAVSFSQAAVRNILRIVDCLPTLLVPGLVGFVTAACSRESRRLGDHAAGTLVVLVDRQDHQLQALPAMTAVRDRVWKVQAGARLASLSRPQQQALLDLCLRRDQLRLAERAQLFGEVARYLQQHLALVPEEFESDEKFVLQLTAILSESVA